MEQNLLQRYELIQFVINTSYTISDQQHTATYIDTIR
jgi:hypothetical protein